MRITVKVTTILILLYGLAELLMYIFSNRQIVTVTGDKLSAWIMLTVITGIVSFLAWLIYEGNNG